MTSPQQLIEKWEKELSLLKTKQLFWNGKDMYTEGCIHEAIVKIQLFISDLKELEKENESEAINFVDWLTSENSEFAIIYGGEKRFATKEKDFTIKEVYDKFKNTLKR